MVHTTWQHSFSHCKIVISWLCSHYRTGFKHVEHGLNPEVSVVQYYCVGLNVGSPRNCCWWLTFRKLTYCKWVKVIQFEVLKWVFVNRKWSAFCWNWFVSWQSQWYDWKKDWCEVCQQSLVSSNYIVLFETPLSDLLCCYG